MRLRKKIIVTLLVVIFCIALEISSFITSSIRNNPLPKSINMGAMDMGKMPAVMNMVTTVPKTASIPISSLRLGSTNAPIKNYILTAQVVKHPGFPDAYTFNGTVPGPAIHIAQGEHLHVVLVNALPVATTIHWHGIQVPNSADGPAGVTQDAVKPGKIFAYDFIASESGTYWYHSHQDASNQIPKGLFGALIVDPKKTLLVNHDYTVIYHDQPESSTLGSKLQAIGGIINRILGKNVPRHLAINGHTDTYNVAANPGESVRLRIINASQSELTGAPIRLAPVGIPFQIVAIDGHDINQPQSISKQIIAIGTGQRYDIQFTMPQTGSVELKDMDNPETITIGKNINSPISLNDLTTFDLTQYGKSAPDLLLSTGHFDQNINLVLGAKPGFRFGRFELIHTINRKAFPKIPNIIVSEGQTIHLHIVNTTDETHPMHLHGHIFTLLSKNGKQLTGSPMHADSILVGPKETWDVAFVANNPGIWMFHCHVLSHAAFGMDMMVVYKNISTPYTVGTISGNFPD